MDALVRNLQGLEGSPGQQHSMLQQSEDVLSYNLPALDGVLLALNPAQFTLPWVYILHIQSKAQMAGDAAESFVHNSTTFLLACSEDVRLVPDKFASICHKFKEVTIQMRQPRRAILPLRDAIRKIQPSAEYLTPQHADFAQVCLLAKCYSVAVPVLDNEIYEVDPAKTGMHPRDFLLYCYYGGMVYTGEKMFGKAMEFYLNAITAPSMVMNAIIVAAYKKYVCVSLIAKGQVPSFPKYTSSVVTRHLKSCCQEYTDISNAYAARSVNDLNKCIVSHQDVFAADNNMGLVKQCVGSLHKRKIQGLTQTYLTLSLQDIADSVQLGGAQEAEACILKMIEAGEIFATISQRDGMVNFKEDPEQYNTAATLSRLDKEIHRMMALALKLQAADVRVSCDKAYLSKVNSKERGRWQENDDYDGGGHSTAASRVLQL